MEELLAIWGLGHLASKGVDQACRWAWNKLSPHEKENAEPVVRDAFQDLADRNVVIDAEADQGVLCGILEAAARVSDRELQAMFSGLLSGTLDNSAEVHPDDVFVLGRMSTVDARVLTLVYQYTVEHRWPAPREDWAPMQRIGEMLELSSNVLQVADKQLQLLGLIEHENLVVHSPNVDAHSVRFTAKGRRFAGNCMRVPPDIRDAEVE